MLKCQQCNQSLKKTEEENFIVKCKCGHFNRFRRVDTNGADNQKKGRKYKGTGSFGKVTKSITQYGILYTYRIEDYYTHFRNFKKISPKTTEALEKFINDDKESLDSQEINILYKLKAESMEKINKKIQYLKAKSRFIDLLNALNL